MHVFQNAGVAHQVNLTPRHASFLLNTPDRHYDYLVCNDCGVAKDLPDAQILFKLQEQLINQCGFAALQREVKFYGVCPKCQAAGHKTGKQ
jgi:Fur family transcriptional regulator, ferric uptake regulator